MDHSRSTIPKDEIEEISTVGKLEKNDLVPTGIMGGAPKVEKDGIRRALVSIFSWHNYSVYILTSWVFSGFQIINSYFNLYLRAIGWDFALLGGVIALSSSLAATFRIIGGYIGDVVDRKKLSVLAMFLSAIYFVIMGLFTDPFMIIIALLVFATVNIGKGGSSAYILDNTPREHSGLAMSLFTAGRIFGVFTITVFNFMVPLFGFPQSFRIVAITGGFALIVSSALRAVYLDSSPTQKEKRIEKLWWDFVAENWNALQQMIKIIPGALLIIMIDAFSDALFNFGALIYANEFLGVSINGIGIMLMTVLVISVPLLLKIGRMSDKSGVRRTGLIVYSVMPFCTGLLFIAPIVPVWASQDIILAAESVSNGLGAIFTTAFIAIVLKQINDTLWWLIVVTMIQKNLPHKDTSKFLAVFWFIVYVFSSIGPIVAGLLFTFTAPPTLFGVAFVLNIVILVLIATRGLTSNDIDSRS